MIDFQIERIVPECESFGVLLDRQAVERLNLYGNLLLEWNQKINLTAITDPLDVLYKHFYDCLLLLKAAPPPANATVIDVGTGAGFPGLVLKIARPDLQVTLLDSLNKRLLFLNEVISRCGLSQAACVHMRAEDAGKTPSHRERYDLACARAVAALPVLTEYCLPLVKPGGLFVAMKGPSAEEELKTADRAVRLLGGAQPAIVCETLTGKEQRAFITVKKISQTPTKYPRKPNEIAKQPL